MTNNNILNELKWREMLKDFSNEEKIINAQNKNLGVYCGFDPTSDSLHIGNLIQMLVLKRFNDFGFKAYAIIGEGTAVIGDPSGKKSERQLQSFEAIKNNIANIKKQIKNIIPNAIILNNNDWLSKITMINFLHDIGKTFNVSYLINKEHIKSRLSTGISYTEFTYTLLQSYDFYYLYKNHNVAVQIGGSDQWGNITSGIEYIKNNINDSNAAGLTIQLLLKPDGNKFGKTESGTIWLDRNKTNPYTFYQFFFNQDDKLSLKLLKYFSFYSENEINNINKKHLENPKERYIQKCLASCLTKIVHSQEDLDNIEEVSNILFRDKVVSIKEVIISSILKNILPTTFITKDKINIIDFLVNNKICQSKREGREFIANNAIMVNGKTINDLKTDILQLNPLYKKYFLVKKGKKKHFLVVIK